MKISDIKKSIDVNDFFKEIEECKTSFTCSYLDAVMHCCEARGIELETAATIIRSNPTMKKKLQECSKSLKMLVE